MCDISILAFSRSCWNDKCPFIRAEFDNVLRNFFFIFSVLPKTNIQANFHV